MALGDIMTARIVTVQMDDRLEVVKEIFEIRNFHHLRVVDENKKSRDLATFNQRVHQIMTRHPITRPPVSTTADAVNVLLGIAFRTSR